MDSVHAWQGRSAQYFPFGGFLCERSRTLASHCNLPCVFHLRTVFFVFNYWQIYSNSHDKSSPWNAWFRLTGRQHLSMLRHANHFGTSIPWPVESMRRWKTLGVISRQVSPYFGSHHSKKHSGKYNKHNYRWLARFRLYKAYKYEMNNTVTRYVLQNQGALYHESTALLSRLFRANKENDNDNTGHSKDARH